MGPSDTPLCFAFVTGLLVSSGCAQKTEPHDAAAPPSKADIVQEFDAFVAERNACTQVAECVMLSPGCPLGCGVAVRSEHAVEVEAKAKALIAEAEKQNGACTYKCAALHLECSSGRCAAVPD